MKAIIVSDVHKMAQRKNVLDFFRNRKFDAIFVNGDLLGEYAIPQSVKEFEALERYLKLSNGAELVKVCAPNVADELIEVLGEIRGRHPDKDELDLLESLLERYANERYDGIVDFLGELTKSGNVFFNYGESESPYGLAIENEIAQLTRSDPELIMKLRPKYAFKEFEKKLYALEEETHLFHYVSDERVEFGGYTITGIPGIFGESRGSDAAQEQEGITMRVLDDVEDAGKLIILYHSTAPSAGVFGVTKGSESLLSFLKDRHDKTIVINSHYHLLNSVFVHAANVWYIITTAALNDELSLVDTEGVRYFEIRMPSGRATELSPVVIHDWKETVPDLLKRMY